MIIHAKTSVDILYLVSFFHPPLKNNTFIVLCVSVLFDSTGEFPAVVCQFQYKVNVAQMLQIDYVHPQAISQ